MCSCCDLSGKNKIRAIRGNEKALPTVPNGFSSLEELEAKTVSNRFRFPVSVMGVDS